MAMHTPTRRGLIGAIAATPAAIVMASMPAAAMTSHADIAAWNAAFATMQKLVAEERAYGALHDKAYDAFNAERPKLPQWYRSVMDIRGRLDASDVEGSLAKELAGEGRWWWGAGHKQRLVEGANELREHNAAEQVVDERHNFSAIETRYEEIGDAAYDATWALFRIPAPHLAALVWKAEHLFGETARGTESSAPAWSSDVIENYMSDMRRLCGEA